jgi:DNA-binding LacI/PurR family transcriptional regulator
LCYDLRNRFRKKRIDMPACINDIAERAGVSRGTVSKVLNGSSESIRQHTKDRIHRAVHELGYQPNRIARSLIRGRTDTIGLIIRDLRNPFFLEMMRSAEHIAEQSGYRVVTDTALLRLKSGSNTKFSGWPIDGALVWCLSSQNAEMYLGPQASGLPTVYLGAVRTDASDTVALDQYVGAKQAMEYLVRSGHSRIGFACPKTVAVDPGGEDRYTAYMDVCSAHGLLTNGMVLAVEVDGMGVNDSRVRAAGIETGQKLAGLPASERPTALLCYNDLMAISLLHGLRRGGMRVPEDMAVVGYDGIDEGYYLDKRLATVVAPVESLIEKALEILHERMTSGPSSLPLQYTIPTVFRMGETA